MKKQRKWLHLLLVICLIAGSILPYLPAMKLTVSAQETEGSGSGEGTTTTVNKIYVDGVERDKADGLTKDTAFKTLAEALQAVPSDNVETYIIVCGEINVKEDANTTGYQYYFRQHEGKVIITSVFGTEDYRPDAKLNFENKTFGFLGETKFENIRIDDEGGAKGIYANFFPLHFGEGIEGKDNVADVVYMGTRNDSAIKNIVKEWLNKGKDVQLTIDSGKYGTVYGGSYYYQTVSAADNDTVITINGGEISGCLYGTGANYGGDNPPNNNVSMHKSVSLNVNGGTINELYAMDAAAIVSGEINLNLRGGTINKVTCIGDLFADKSANGAPHAQSGIKVTVAGTTVREFGASAVNESAKGTYQLHYDGSALTTGNLTATMSGVNEFTEWKLTGTSLSVAENAAESWVNVTKIEMTDDSSLTLGAVPTADMIVKIQRSGESWITGTALVKAPIGADSKITLAAAEESEFAGYEFQCESGTENVTWTINSANAGGGTGSGDGTGNEGSGGESTNPAGNVFYVDGVARDNADGKTAATAFKTLTEAYNAINTFNEANPDNTVAYIVVCGNVTLTEGAMYCTDGAYGNHYSLPKHTGKVIITSVYGGINYKENAKLAVTGLPGIYILGETVFENIIFSGTASAYYANYFPLHFSVGVETEAGNDIAKYITTGTSERMRKMGGYNYITDNTVAAKDVTLTIDSGEFEIVLGRSYVYQGPDPSTNSIVVNINGGKIDYLCGSNVRGDRGSTASNVTVNVAGGTITNLYGAGVGATITGKVQVNVSGGTITNLYGVGEYLAKNGKTYTTTVNGDVEVWLKGGTVTNVNAIQDDDTVSGEVTVKGNTIIHVGSDDVQSISSITMPAVQNFSTLKLSNGILMVPDAEKWSGIDKVQITDNSLLKFESAPSEKIEVVAFKSGTEWQTTNPLIQAPSSTAADIFNLMDPMDYQLACTGDANGTYWTMEKASISIGEPGTPGTALNLDLGLPNGTFTPIDADADAYEVYQQKVADLGEAATEVKVIEPVTVQGEVELHVSPQGNDDNNGSMASPFKTITKALSYVEALENLDVKGIVIYLHEGIYVASDSIVLNEKHSGTNGIPVIISAYGDDEVVVTGGTDIAGTSFTKVTDETVLNRLQEPVKDQIMVVDLKELGISEFGSIVSGRYGGPNYSVEMNGEKLTLARYPDATNLPLGEVLDVGPVTSGSGNFNNGYNSDSTGTEFVMQDLRPTMWENDGNIWLYGNLAVEWAKRHSRVAEIRTATSSIKLEGGVVEGAVSAKSNTYYYYNVLEELNVPGEFYLDHATGKLYIYPIGDMSTATVSFTANASDLFSISGASNIVLNGITIENSGGTGINISSGSQNILVQNCVIRKVHTGAKVYGKNSGIIYSEIYEISERPVQVGWPCSTYKYDEPEHNFVQNCYIYSTGMVGISNTPIYVEGVQNVVSHNLIQGTYAVSIYLYAAAECIIEYNEIVGGPDGTYDYGSIYAAPSGGQTGNHIRYNYIHDTARFSKQDNPHSIYLDEGARGNFVYGNVMANVQNGVYLHYGSDNVVVDNVVMSFREGRNAAGIFGNEKMADKTIAERWERSSAPKQMYELWASYNEADKLVFKQRYPGYADLYEKVAAAIAAAGGSTDTGVGLYMAEGNYAKNNILVGFGGVDFAGREHVVIDNDVFTEDPFADAANHDYALKSGVETSFTYAPLNMSRVGVLCEKKGIEAFSLYAPAAAFEEVDPFNVLLKWTLAGGADTYRVTIASNEALTENVKEFTVEDTCLYMDHDEYFGFGQTCYWKVTANTTAESRVATPVSSAVSSFKTMTEDIYYQYNSADLTELTEVIQEANTLAAQMTEISAGGLYYDGGKESLQAAISTAQAVVDAGVRQEQTDVNAAVSALESAILAAMASQAVTYVTFEELDASEWSDPSAARGQAAVSGDELQLSFQTGSRTEVVYDKLIGSREILCFDFALDQQKNWHGFAIGQSDRGKFITNSTGYFVCFSGDEIQLQKYIDGVKVTGADLLKITNTGEGKLFASGQTYSIQLGALQNADGSVRILFKVDDNVIIDYLDIENPIVGDNGFGVVIQKLATNGVAHLKQADLTGVEKADYTALETELAKEETLTEGEYTEESWAAYQQVVDIAEVITKELTSYDQMIVNELVYELQIAFNALEKKTVGSEIEIQINNNTGIGENVALITAPADGWTEGTNTFTVTSEKASVVLVSYDGGVTYERLAATKADDDAENSYRFTAENVTADTQITVAVAGDVNGDGKISNADITKLRLAYAQKTELDAVQEILADVNGSNSLTNADITKLRLAYAGKSELIW